MRGRGTESSGCIPPRGGVMPTPRRDLRNSPTEAGICRDQVRANRDPAGPARAIGICPAASFADIPSPEKG